VRSRERGEGEVGEEEKGTGEVLPEEGREGGLSPDVVPPTFDFADGEVESLEVVVLAVVDDVALIVLGLVEVVVVVVEEVEEVAGFFNLEMVGEVEGEAFFASFLICSSFSPTFSLAGAFLVT
jgi:hypothetical protein